MIPKIAILGTGALASLFAAKLHALAEVHMFGHWAEQKSRIRLYGLEFVDREGETENIPVQVSDYADYTAYFDVILVLIKSWQTERAAYECLKLLNSSEASFVLSLQNGMGNLETLQEVGVSNSFAGVTLQGAQLKGLGKVMDSGKGPVILPDSVPYYFVDLLRDADFDVRQESNISSLLWSKLLINAAINPLTALFQVKNGDLLKSDALLDLLKKLSEEASRLASECRVRLIFEDPYKEVLEVVMRTSENHSSMYSDIKRGAPTEIESISGFLLKKASSHNLEMPATRKVYNWMKQLIEAGTIHDPEFLLIKSRV